MKEAVLYTGTFNPYHLGHLWQLERTYHARPFDKAVIAVIRKNPKKPNVTSLQNRVELVKLMLAEQSLPFDVEVHSIDYIYPDMLKKFVDERMNGYRAIRTVASDSIVEFIDERQFHNALLMFHYTITVRPLVGLREVEKAILKLPSGLARKFSCEIVHVQTEDDISGTNIRKDPRVAYEKGYITRSQLDFITNTQLY